MGKRLVLFLLRIGSRQDKRDFDLIPKPVQSRLASILENPKDPVAVLFREDDRGKRVPWLFPVWHFNFERTGEIEHQPILHREGSE
jgi:hypothetical protein